MTDREIHDAVLSVLENADSALTTATLTYRVKNQLLHRPINSDNVSSALIELMGDGKIDVRMLEHPI